MSFSENMTWLAIGLTAAAYITHRQIETAKVKLPAAPSAQKEVDPTRWRHDGRQELTYRDGNRFTNDDTFREELLLHSLLAF